VRRAAVQRNAKTVLLGAEFRKGVESRQRCGQYEFHKGAKSTTVRIVRLEEEIGKGAERYEKYKSTNSVKVRKVRILGTTNVRNSGRERFRLDSGEIRKIFAKIWSAESSGFNHLRASYINQ
jgi:hypothetical protein